MWTVLCLSVALSPAEPPAQPAAPAATLEYKVVPVEWPKPAKDVAARDKALNELGADGWELTAVAVWQQQGGFTGPPAYLDHFKRPVRAAREAKWEYRTLDLPPHGPDRVDPEKVPVRLGRESADGWELAGVYPEAVANNFADQLPRYYCLKRVKR
jgi:hypothetical protein